MSYGLILGGGTALGAVQEPIVRKLYERLGRPKWVVGTSVGSLTAVQVAGGKAGLDRLTATWDDVDGASFFQKPRIDIWNGFFSLNPLRRELVAREGAARLFIPTYVGLVDAATQEHRLVQLNGLPLVERHDAIICSCAQPIIHRREKLHGRVCLDGGVASVLGVNQQLKQLIKGVDEFHVISCSPTRLDRRRTRSPDKVDNVWEAAQVAFEVMLNRSVNRDLLILRRFTQHSRAPKRMWLYAPGSWGEVGEAFDASAETIRHRRHTVATAMMNKAELWG